jgi:integrase
LQNYARSAFEELDLLDRMRNDHLPEADILRDHIRERRRLVGKLARTALFFSLNHPGGINSPTPIKGIPSVAEREKRNARIFRRVVQEVNAQLNSRFTTRERWGIRIAVYTGLRPASVRKNRQTENLTTAKQ